MFPAPLFFRLPIIRHIRATWHRYQVNKHYAHWQKLGYAPSRAAEDYEVIEKIWRGEL